MLGDSLAHYGIASLRYDKRGIAKSQVPNLNEVDMSFDQFIDDAISWVQLLKKDDRFNTVTIAGHSQGSLVGMIAADMGADRFISIAGGGQKAGALIIKQLQQRAPILVEESQRIIDQLEQGILVDSVHPFLINLFRPSVQPFLISYLKYDPITEIAKLDIPVLIINGTMDIQTDESEANRLYQSLPTSKIHIIDNMNHILKMLEPDSDVSVNMASYNDPNSPISVELVKTIVSFIRD